MTSKYDMAWELSCPAELLEEFSRDSDPNVRCGVARNANCPVEILGRLRSDADVRVRLHVAANPTCPDEWRKEIETNSISF